MITLFLVAGGIVLYLLGGLLTLIVAHRYYYEFDFDADTKYKDREYYWAHHDDSETATAIFLGWPVAWLVWVVKGVAMGIKRLLRATTNATRKNGGLK